MLADNDAAVGHQLVGSLALGGQIIPGAGVLNFHVRLGDDGLDAQEEGGVAADHLSVGISAHVADLGIGDGTGVHQLLELHAGHHAGDVAGLIGVGEDILVVIEAGTGSQVAGAGDKGHVGIIRGRILHEGLMTVGIGEDDVAALLRQIHGGVIAVLVFSNVVLKDDLAGIDAQLLAGGGQAVDVGHVVAGVLIVDADEADLHGFRGDAGILTAGRLLRTAVPAAGRQAQSHGQGEEHRKKLLFHKVSSFSLQK